jgi:hypothetical protein
MTLDRCEAVNRAGHLAVVFSSLKALGLTDRNPFNEIMRDVLLANSRLLGVWTVREPNALDGREQLHSGTPAIT